MPKPAKSIEEIFPLIEFCKAGKLTEVTQWIEEGKPLDPPPAKRRSSRRMPLQIAIEKNFYSLAELLLEGGADPFLNGNALRYCVTKSRPDIAGLLLEQGVPAESVDFVYVCEMGNPEIIRLFLERGVDPTTDFAFYHAIVGMTKPALGIYKEWEATFPALKKLLNAALLHFVNEERARGVALCLWAGAEPAEPAIDVESSGKEEWREFPLVAAAWKGNLEILKALHPERHPDLLGEVLQSSRRRKSVIDYLLKLGAPLNEKPNGGSALLDRTICDLGWFINKDVVETLDMIRYLVGKGAKWIPDEPGDFRSIRSNFKNLTGPQIVEFVRIIWDGDAATKGVIEELLGTQTMKEVLGRHRSEVEMIMNPPPPEPPAPQEQEKLKSQEPTRNMKKTPIEEVRKRAEAFLIDFLCQRPSIPFWTGRISDHPPVAKTRKVMGLSNHDNRDAVEILQEAAVRVEDALGCAEIRIRGNVGWGLAEVIFELREGVDWKEAIRKAWGISGREPNEYLLTDVGAKTLAWLQNSECVNEFIKERSLSHRMGLGGRLSDLEEHLKEISLKTPKVVKWETRGDRHSNPPLCYKLWLEDSEAPREPSDAWNPVLDFNLEDFQKSELDQCKDSILDHLLEAQPEGMDPVAILCVDSLPALRTLFPKARFDQYFRGPNLPGLFSRLKLPVGLKVAYDFRREAPFWFVNVHPAGAWTKILKEIEEKKNRPSLKQLYQLSDEAANLLSWITDLDEAEMEYGLSPVVNDELGREIGIKSPWESDNLPAYLQILVEEISDKTPWELRLQPWKHHSSWHSRIRIRKSNDLESSLIRQIQLYALEHGKAVPGDAVREKLAMLLGELE